MEKKIKNKKQKGGTNLSPPKGVNPGSPAKNAPLAQTPGQLQQQQQQQNMLMMLQQQQAQEKAAAQAAQEKAAADAAAQAAQAQAEVAAQAKAAAQAAAQAEAQAEADTAAQAAQAEQAQEKAAADAAAPAAPAQAQAEAQAQADAKAAAQEKAAAPAAAAPAAAAPVAEETKKEKVQRLVKEEMTRLGANEPTEKRLAATRKRREGRKGKPKIEDKVNEPLSVWIYDKEEKRLKEIEIHPMSELPKIDLTNMDVDQTVLSEEKIKKMSTFSYKASSPVTDTYNFKQELAERLLSTGEISQFMSAVDVKEGTEYYYGFDKSIDKFYIFTIEKSKLDDKSNFHVFDNDTPLFMKLYHKTEKGLQGTLGVANQKELEKKLSRKKFIKNAAITLTSIAVVASGSLLSTVTAGVAAPALALAVCALQECKVKKNVAAVGEMGNNKFLNKEGSDSFNSQMLLYKLSSEKDKYSSAAATGDDDGIGEIVAGTALSAMVINAAREGMEIVNENQYSNQYGDYDLYAAWQNGEDLSSDQIESLGQQVYDYTYYPEYQSAIESTNEITTWQSTSTTDADYWPNLTNFADSYDESGNICSDYDNGCYYQGWKEQADQPAQAAEDQVVNLDGDVNTLIDGTIDDITALTNSFENYEYFEMEDINRLLEGAFDDENWEFLWENPEFICEIGLPDAILVKIFAFYIPKMLYNWSQEEIIDGKSLTLEIPSPNIPVSIGIDDLWENMINALSHDDTETSENLDSATFSIRDFGDRRWEKKPEYMEWKRGVSYLDGNRAYLYDKRDEYEKTCMMALDKTRELLYSPLFNINEESFDHLIDISDIIISTYNIDKSGPDVKAPFTLSLINETSKQSFEYEIRKMAEKNQHIKPIWFYKNKDVVRTDFPPELVNVLGEICKPIIQLFLRANLYAFLYKKLHTQEPNLIRTLNTGRINYLEEDSYLSIVNDILESIIEAAENIKQGILNPEQINKMSFTNSLLKYNRHALRKVVESNDLDEVYEDFQKKPNSNKLKALQIIEEDESVKVLEEAAENKDTVPSRLRDRLLKAVEAAVLTELEIFANEHIPPGAKENFIQQAHAVDKKGFEGDWKDHTKWSDASPLGVDQELAGSWDLVTEDGEQKDNIIAQLELIKDGGGLEKFIAANDRFLKDHKTVFKKLADRKKKQTNQKDGWTQITRTELEELTDNNNPMNTETIDQLLLELSKDSQMRGGSWQDRNKNREGFSDRVGEAWNLQLPMTITENPYKCLHASIYLDRTPVEYTHEWRSGSNAINIQTENFMIDTYTNSLKITSPIFTNAKLNDDNDDIILTEVTISNVTFKINTVTIIDNKEITANLPLKDFLKEYNKSNIIEILKCIQKRKQSDFVLAELEKIIIQDRYKELTDMIKQFQRASIVKFRSPKTLLNIARGETILSDNSELKEYINRWIDQSKQNRLIHFKHIKIMFDMRQKVMDEFQNFCTIMNSGITELSHSLIQEYILHDESKYVNTLFSTIKMNTGDDYKRIHVSRTTYELFTSDQDHTEDDLTEDDLKLAEYEIGCAGTKLYGYYLYELDDRFKDDLIHWQVGNSNTYGHIYFNMKDTLKEIVKLQFEQMGTSFDSTQKQLSTDFYEQIDPLRQRANVLVDSTEVPKSVNQIPKQLRDEIGRPDEASYLECRQEILKQKTIISYNQKNITIYNDLLWDDIFRKLANDMLTQINDSGFVNLIKQILDDVLGLNGIMMTDSWGTTVNLNIIKSAIETFKSGEPNKTNWTSNMQKRYDDYIEWRSSSISSTSTWQNAEDGDIIESWFKSWGNSIIRGLKPVVTLIVDVFAGLGIGLTALFELSTTTEFSLSKLVAPVVATVGVTVLTGLDIIYFVAYEWLLQKTFLSKLLPRIQGLREVDMSGFWKSGNIEGYTGRSYSKEMVLAFMSAIQNSVLLIGNTLGHALSDTLKIGFDALVLIMGVVEKSSSAAIKGLKIINAMKNVYYAEKTLEEKQRVKDDLNKKLKKITYGYIESFDTKILPLEVERYNDKWKIGERIMKKQKSLVVKVMKDISILQKTRHDLEYYVKKPRKLITQIDSYLNKALGSVAMIAKEGGGTETAVAPRVLSEIKADDALKKQGDVQLIERRNLIKIQNLCNRLIQTLTDIKNLTRNLVSFCDNIKNIYKIYIYDELNNEIKLGGDTYIAVNDQNGKEKGDTIIFDNGTQQITVTLNKYDATLTINSDGTLTNQTISGSFVEYFTGYNEYKIYETGGEFYMHRNMFFDVYWTKENPISINNIISEINKIKYNEMVSSDEGDGSFKIKDLITKVEVTKTAVAEQITLEKSKSSKSGKEIREEFNKGVLEVTIPKIRSNEGINTNVIEVAVTEMETEFSSGNADFDETNVMKYVIGMNEFMKVIEEEYNNIKSKQVSEEEAE